MKTIFFVAKFSVLAELKWHIAGSATRSLPQLGVGRWLKIISFLGTLDLLVSQKFKEVCPNWLFLYFFFQLSWDTTFVQNLSVLLHLTKLSRQKRWNPTVKLGRPGACWSELKPFFLVCWSNWPCSTWKKILECRAHF